MLVPNTPQAAKLTADQRELISKAKSKRDVGGVDYIFPTPIYINYIDNYKDIQDEMLTGIHHSDFEMHPHWGSTHWLSDPTFQGNFVEEHRCKKFKEELDWHVQKYAKEALIGQFSKDNFNYKIVDSWVALFKKNNYAHIHSHGAADISGVYYIQTPAKEEASKLFFQDDRGAKSAEIPAEQGVMLLFPGYLRHGVQTNTNDVERLSLSFNIKIGSNLDETHEHKVAGT
tara:strand:- start:419 stop:1105 length:687 start_codon:yes stop_codon:yes gene_type:complete